MTDGGDRDAARVTVAVRVRPKLAHPLNALQRSERYEEIICVPSSHRSLRLADSRAAKGVRDLHFAYDHVLDVDATQEDVYDAAVVDCVDDVLAGTNASVLTYGQTGSGKTFTVLGRVSLTAGDAADASHAVGADTGLLLRAIQDMLLFAERMHAKQERHVILGITATEVYMDEIRDLLRDGVAAARPLQPIMTRDALRVPHLTHAPLHSLRDACDVYERATARRVQRATSANDTSSRSHAIFTVEVFQVPMTRAGAAPPSLAECCALREAQLAGATAASSLRFSTLTVADLAGSEKVKHAEVTGAGFEELRRINASLTALGNVVHHLHRGSPHIPYRDSKLTMMLRDTFAAPRARVVLVANVSPTAATCEETLSSLYFAEKMKTMTLPDACTASSSLLSSRQVALQAAYLASLRTHDALLADLRIFQAEQEHSTGLLQHAVAAEPQQHALLQLPFHTVLPHGAEKSAFMAQLCSRLRERLADDEAPDVRLRRFEERRQREMCREMLHQHSRRRAELHATIAAIGEASVHRRAELSRDEAEMVERLRAEKRATDAVAATRAQLTALREARLAELQRLHDCAEEHVSDDGDGAAGEAAERDAEAEGTADDAADDAADAGGLQHVCEAALEMALLRQALVQQWAPCSPASATAEGRGDCVVEESRPTAAAAAAAAATLTPIEAWMRGAVLAMARNAVVQSSRRRQQQQQSEQQLRQLVAGAQHPPQRPPRVLGDVTNTSGGPAVLPKYWTVRRGCEEEEEAAAAATAVATRARSSFDDPGLLTRVTAYMDMGAALVKLDRGGRPHTRWFFLAQRGGRLLLCWDDSRRGSAVAGGAHVRLDAVVAITLGRSSPAFAKYVAALRGEDVGDLYTSFTVSYRAGAGEGALKRVDVLCRDRGELETWVVGLAHWAGVSPTFGDVHHPDVQDGAATVAALSPAEAALCRNWHVPVETLLRTRREVETRRQRHQSGRLRLSPGELRDVTGLDVFRASALWWHLSRDGGIVNSCPTLRCYVADTADSTPAGSDV
ncbi:kinesin [Novymonas esmeraldas]|uniref:Kinesin n=1 Tax=Novymonas esmeraldas TaxID=1808958 RepID=A0AAW0ELR4_9TRYP